VCLCQNNGHSEPANSKQRAKVDVGKEDPFSELPRKKKEFSVSRRISDISSIEYTPELFVETVTLKFLEAKNLKKAIDSMSSQYGSIATDSTTNSLIICDAMEKLEQIITEIKKADQTPEQIMIEVVILDVQLQDDTEIGVDWEELLGTQADFSLSQDLTSLTTGVTFKAVKKDISGTLRALQEKRSVEILASPRVLVLSGHEAYIKTIEEIPYDEVITSTETGETASGLTNVEFKEIGIRIE
jgi:type II secretory pathway component GspD/PulD (secretin)